MNSEADSTDFDGAPVWQPRNSKTHQLFVLEGNVNMPHSLTSTGPCSRSKIAHVNSSEIYSICAKRKLGDSDQHQKCDSSLPYKLMVVRQPEEQHRARYLSEGSRGAIKDRSGSSHCTIQLTGFYRPTRVELYAAPEDGHPIPHPLYQLIPVSGKSANTTPCQKIIATDGIECLEVFLRPESSMTAVLDCMGLLKICSYDAKHKRNIKSSSSKNVVVNSPNLVSAGTVNCSTINSANMAQNSVRIILRSYIPLENGLTGKFHIIQTETEPIRCVQQLGVPEVLKMSLNGALAKGGAELFIIGRNFDRNTKVVFREYKEDGNLGWSAEAYMDKRYLHQCHIVCTVPAYHNLYRGGTVSVTVICASKASHPRNFVYAPSEEEEDDWRPPGSPHLSVTDSFDFMSSCQQLDKTPHTSYYSTAMPFFDYDGTHSNTENGHSSSTDPMNPYMSTSLISSNSKEDKEQNSYEPVIKQHFQRQQNLSFSSSQYNTT